MCTVQFCTYVLLSAWRFCLLLMILPKKACSRRNEFTNYRTSALPTSFVISFIFTQLHLKTYVFIDGSAELSGETAPLPPGHSEEFPHQIFCMEARVPCTEFVLVL
ncbi:hypothetical protein DFH27DRAFT_104740 [Peziza echinospora]|nr:hypothetical protein DFH27DRAFT_104740 [Peziza echinospora]